MAVAHNDQDPSDPIYVEVTNPGAIGGGGGGGAVTVADGADVAQGITTDAAVVTDVAGTLSGKLRGLVKWAYERMPASLGQKAKTASLPVVIASDQDVLGVTDAGVGATADAVVAAGATGSLSAKLRRATQGLEDLKTLLVLAAGENHVGAVGGALTVVAGVEFTRPANATPYTAGDVVSNDATTTVPITLANVARVSGGSGYIVGARLWTDLKSVTPRVRVHLYNASNATVAGDNLPMKTLYTEIGKRIASFDLAAMSTPADTSNSTLSGATDFTLRLPFVAVARDIYAVLETLDAFTPASGEKFSLVLAVDQN